MSSESISSLDARLRELLEQRRNKGRFRSLKEYKTDAGSIGTSSAGSLPKGKEKAVEPLLDFVSTTHDH